mgnify:CR=1 FL=1
MEEIVILIGGSVILSDDVHTLYFKNLVNLLEKLSKTFKIYIIVGGGKTARTYIRLGRELRFGEKTLDDSTKSNSIKHANLMLFMIIGFIVTTKIKKILMPDLKCWSVTQEAEFLGLDPSF